MGDSLDDTGLGIDGADIPHHSRVIE
jgi:hypothetical protein